MGRSRPACTYIALCLSFSCTAARAVELGSDIELHGYGAQNYLDTSANTYLGADRRGTLENNLVALVATVALGDRSKLWVQLEHESPEPLRFDWFFVDYRFNDKLRVQVGRTKLPFGIQNEIIDAQYLQLSAIAPALYQEGLNFTPETFQGIGLDYEGGPLRAQLWAGNAVSEHEEEEEAQEHEDGRAFGAKLIYATPIEGLKLMLSAFRVQVGEADEDDLQNADRQGLSLEYSRKALKLETEYATRKLQDEEANTYYLQAGYTFAEKWTPYVRYDSAVANESLDADPAYYQKALVFGLGYKIGQYFSVRVEDHVNRGYAIPVAGGEMAAGEGRKNWNLFAASVNFMF